MVSFGIQAPIRRLGEPVDDISAQAPTAKGGTTEGRKPTVPAQEQSQVTRSFCFNFDCLELKRKDRKYPSVETVLNLTDLDPSMNEYDDDEEQGSHAKHVDNQKGRNPEPASHDPHSRFEQQLAAKMAAENPTGCLFSTVMASSAPTADDYVGYLVEAVPFDDEPSIITDCEVGTNQSHHSIENVGQGQQVTETPVSVLREEKEKRNKVVVPRNVTKSF